MNTEIYISIDSDFVSNEILKGNDFIFFQNLINRIIKDSDYSYYEIGMDDNMYMIFDKKLFDIMNPEHLGKMIIFISNLKIKDNDSLSKRVENTIGEMLNELVNIVGFSSAILYITDN